MLRHFTITQHTSRLETPSRFWTKVVLSDTLMPWRGEAGAELHLVHYNGAQTVLLAYETPAEAQQALSSLAASGLAQS
eukprot:m51a1_g12182 hypothetical protein (78) ;mRNA; r:4237-4657